MLKFNGKIDLINKFTKKINRSRKAKEYIRLNYRELKI